MPAIAWSYAATAMPEGPSATSSSRVSQSEVAVSLRPAGRLGGDEEGDGMVEKAM